MGSQRESGESWPFFRKFEANSELFNENLREEWANLPLSRPIHPKKLFGNSQSTAVVPELRPCVMTGAKIASCSSLQSCMQKSSCTPNFVKNSLKMLIYFHVNSAFSLVFASLWDTI
ncbi:MAG: hypothetical protein BECKG1743D_GA0114223_106373, partial [Candidatus Kentron sp. G]